jgi:predicted lipoprotein with Yx(FWY)xxD motif
VTSPSFRLIGASAVALVVGFGGAMALVGHPTTTTPHAADAATQASAAPAGHSMAGMEDMPGMENMPGMGGGGVTLYAVQTGTLGIIVTDGGGHVLYGSVKDANDPPAARCTGTCADEWEPLVVPGGQQPQLLGVKADQVGRVERSDGADQLTLGGWPVYINKSDTGELEAAAPDAHGAWFAMTPQGEKVPL